MIRAARRWRSDLLAIGFITVVALAVTWPVTVGGRALLPTDLYLLIQPWRAHAHEFHAPERPSNPILDAVQQFYPWRLHAGRQVREGRIPLWTPQMLSGTPFVANNQSAVFYPETWLHYVMDSLQALGWATLMFLVVAGGSMYAFLRVIGCRPVAASIGGVAFMLSGYFVGWMTFPSFRSVGAWLPLMLLGFEQSVRTQRPAWLALTAVGTGMQFLAGNLHISIYMLLGFGAYVIARLGARLVDGEGKARVGRELAMAAGAVALGAMLAGCQLGPSLEFTQLNYRRGGVEYATQVHHALAPPQLLLGLMPDIFGNPADGNHWGDYLNTIWGRANRVYTETAWYFGIAPLLLGIAGLIVHPRRQSWFWLAVLLGALGLAFGTPLNAVVRALVPGYGQLTGIGRAVVLACTAGVVLGALGAESLMQATDERALRVISGVGLALLLVGLAGGMATWVFTGSLEAAGAPPGLGTYALQQVARFAVLLLMSWALIAAGLGGRRHAWCALALLVAIDVGIFAQRFMPEGPTEYLQVQPDVVAAIHAGEQPARIATVGPDFLNRMAPNTHMIFDLQSMQGSESLIWAPYHRLLQDATSQRYGFEQVDPAHPCLDWLAVRWLVTPLEIDLSGWRLHGIYETRLYENRQALPRAFVPQAIETHPTEQAALASAAAEQDPWTIHLASDDTAAAGPPEPCPGEARVIAYEPNSVRVDVEPGAGWLVLADPAYPGWRAFAGDRELPILRANGVLRAVMPPEDASEVRFAYLPASFRVGMFATLLALGALVGIGVAVAVGRSRE